MIKGIFSLSTTILLLNIIASCNAVGGAADTDNCELEGARVCRGQVTEELGNMVKVCTDGRIGWKMKKNVEPGPCQWYGNWYCEGEEVMDPDVL